MNDKKQQPRRANVLSDHKRVGKRFIPPFIASINLSEVSWVDEIIPQLIWIAILIDAFDFQKGVEYSSAISRFARATVISKKSEWFGWLSSFSSLSEQEKSLLVEKLKADGILGEINSALLPFVSLYPNFPMSFLASTVTRDHEDSTTADIKSIKRILLNMYDRRSVFAMRVQATVIYLAFLNDSLKVAKGTALADFPEIENYPDTEKSREVAASARAMINAFAGDFKDLGFGDWSNYFWNRGLEITPCQTMDINID